MWTNTRKKKAMSTAKQINSLAEVKCLAVATAGKRETEVGNGQERKLFFCFLFFFLFLFLLDDWLVFSQSGLFLCFLQLRTQHISTR